MVRFSKISPMVRAIGTMGTVAALVGAVTFAQITSNTVALTNNTLSSATASLAIGAAHDCSTGATTSVQGMSFNNLQPGVASSPFPFCLDNTGNVPLNLTASVPTNFGAGINPCGVGGATTGAVNVSTTVGALHTSPVAFGTAALNNGTNNVLSCDVTATITPAASTTSNESLTPFDIQFVGTSTDTANPTTLNNTSATV
jgi:hypothetical protein